MNKLINLLAHYGRKALEPLVKIIIDESLKKCIEPRLIGLEISVDSLIINVRSAKERLSLEAYKRQELQDRMLVIESRLRSLAGYEGQSSILDRLVGLEADVALLKRQP